MRNKILILLGLSFRLAFPLILSELKDSKTKKILSEGLTFNEIRYSKDIKEGIVFLPFELTSYFLFSIFIIFFIYFNFLTSKLIGILIYCTIYYIYNYLLKKILYCPRNIYLTI